MANFNKIILTLILSVLLSCQSTIKRDVANSHHISDAAHKLVTWETKANAVANRSNEVIALEHFEIPLRLLKADYDDTLDQSIKDSLIFEKNGEKYMRWIINPEDTKWHLEVTQFLEKHKVDSTPRRFFDAYLTASRSMILVNPENGASFSLKVSTNKTGGHWTDKKQTWDDAKQIRKLDRWVSEVTANMKTDSMVIMNEPFVAGIEELDHGMVMRSLNDVPKDEHFYIPGFSVLHEKEGARIAKLNGATNVADFWDKHYNQPLAKAMAEFIAYTGVWYDSPHSQNFLVELDKNMKPTGRIVLRDLGDSYILEDFTANTKYSSIASIWEQDNVKRGVLNARVGLMHGNTPPSWLTKSEYQKYARNFFETFEKSFSEKTNIPLAELKSTPMAPSYGFSYEGKSYPTTSESWKNFLKHANCMNGEAKTISGLDCPELFLKQQKRVDCYKNINAILMAQ